MIPVTVFTPTFNRAYCLPKLYDSLCRQTCLEFEWLIVDDGSTDGTAALLERWIMEAPIQIRCLRQDNSGKHIAINRGMYESAGELFFIVDSDDFLAENAIERIRYHYETIKDDHSFCGVCGIRVNPDGLKIGKGNDFGVLDCNSLDFRYKYKIRGDMAEVFRTDVLREFPFPEYAGEKFCTEALVYNRIADKYRIRYFYEKIYICEYLQDGLTAATIKVRRNSPIASTTFYLELFHRRIPIFQKMKSAINFWRFFFCLKSQKRPVDNMSIGWGILFCPAGFIYYLLDSLSSFMD